VARAKKAVDRALGPYRYSDHFMVVVIRATAPKPGEARRPTKKFPFDKYGGEEKAEVAAQIWAEEISREAALAQGITVDEAIDAYRARAAKRNRDRSIETAEGHLRNVFAGVLHLTIGDITEPVAIKAFEAYCARPTRFKRPPAPDTALNALFAARQFLGFCVAQKWARTDVLEAYEPELGDRNRGGKGKKQLTLDDLAKWEAKAFELAEAGDRGAAASLIAEKLGLRASVVVSRQAKHIDLGGAILRVPRERANRTKRAPEIIPVEDARLRPILVSLKLGLGPEDWLFPATGRVGEGRRQFTEEQRRQILAEYDQAVASGDGEGKKVLAQHGVPTSLICIWRRRPAGQPGPLASGHRDRSWLAAQVQRVCRAAGVSEETHAHGMRGIMASLDHIDGRVLAATQAKLGHRQGSSVTEGSYITAEAIHRARQRKMMAVLPGGRDDEDAE
jgi:integrase